MKKTLSVILSVAMLFSSFAFCLPAVAAELDFGVETAENYTATNDETENAGTAALANTATLPITVDFDDGANPFANSNTVTMTVITESETDKALHIKATGPSNGNTLKYTIPSLPLGRYEVSFDINVTDKDGAGSTLANILSTTETFTLKYVSGTNEDSAATTIKTISDVSTDVVHVTQTWDITSESESDIRLLLTASRSAATAPMMFARPVCYIIDNFEIREAQVVAELVFNANGGEGTQTSMTANAGVDTTLPDSTTFTREYYDFVGWAASADGASEDVITIVNLSLTDLTDGKYTLYAVWERRTFDVTLDTLGGTTSEALSYTEYEGETLEITLPARSAVTKQGYVLAGWTDGVNNYSCGQTVEFTQEAFLEAQWLDLSDFGSLTPSSAAGYDDALTDVDPRFHGAYYVFEEALDEDSLSIENIGIENVAGFDYDAATKTLVLFPAASAVELGATISFAHAQTLVKNEDGTKLVALPAVSYTLASTVPEDGTNMIPYGTFEDGYNLFYADADNTEAELVTEGTNTYAEIRATASTSGNARAFFNTYYENGATYKVSGKAKNIGVYNDPSNVGGTLQFNAVFTGTTTYSNPALTDEDENHYATIANTATTDWTSFAYEFTVNKIAATDKNGFVIYSSPASNLMTEFAIDDLEMYRRTDIQYRGNANVMLKAGEALPATSGVYLNENPGATLTVANTMPFESNDARWYIDEEKPWIDQYGNTYALGEQVTMTKTLILVPNLVTDEQIYTITFDSTGVNGTFAPITVFAGESVDIKTYESVTSAVAGKNFNGWSETGNLLDAIHGEYTPTRDVTLKANVSYDLDFMIAQNQEGWLLSNATTTPYKPGTELLGMKVAGSGDTYIYKNNVSIPTGAVKAIKAYIILDAVDDATLYEVGDTVHAIFFGTEDAPGADSSRRITGNVIRHTEDGKYAVVQFLTYSHGAWIGQLTYIRWDTEIEPSSSFAVRALEFVPKDEYTENVISITGIEAPTTGAKPDTTALVNSIGTVNSVTWTPDNLVQGNFFANTAYTVTVKVLPVVTSTAQAFAKDTTATVNGNEANISIGEDGVAVVTYTFTPTDPYAEFDFAITGPATITKAGRATKYSLSITSTEKISDKTAEWAIDDTSLATISNDGMLVPLKNGTVTITATSNYNIEKIATFTVTISGQAEPGEIIYHSGTQASVSNMPAAEEALSLTQLSTTVPTRDGYVFKGWATNEESTNVVTSVTVSPGQTVNVYAVWEKIYSSWEFNTEAEVTAFAPNKGRNLRLEDGCMVFEHIEADGDSYDYKNVDIDTTKVKRMTVGIRSVRNASENQTFYFYVASRHDGVENIVHDTATVMVPNLITYNYPATNETHEMEFDLTRKGNQTSSTNGDGASTVWRDTVTRLRFDFIKDSTNAETWIDYIRFIDTSRTVTFDANTTDSVTGMPDAKSVYVGDKVKVTAPTREGYAFTGWSKTADASTAVKEEWTITDDVTLYAIWSAVASEPVEDGDNLVSTITSVNASDEAILVETNGGKGKTVTVTYTDENGDPQEITATTNSKGMAVIDLTAEGEITDVEISVAAATGLKAATVYSSIADANAKANKVEGGGGGGGGGSSDDFEDFEYDNKVTNVENENESYEANTGEDVVSKINLAEITAAGGEILINFDEEYEKDVFETYRNATFTSIKDSALTVEAIGNESRELPAMFLANLALNAEDHRYVVLKAKHRNLTSTALRLSFREENGIYSSAKSKTLDLGENYSMLVYDMAEFDEWAGVIANMYFSLASGTTGTVEIDWIMFTDTLPDMDDVEGAIELFPYIKNEKLPFNDVKTSDWFHGEVHTAYRLGLVEGVSEESYMPSGNVTLAEAITLAVRLYCAYYEEQEPEVAEGAEWYKNYVDFAIIKKIIMDGQYADYNAPALRKNVALMMSKALPNEWYEKQNMFLSIPDMSKSDPAYSAVLRLYNAGVLMGSDGLYNFYPDTYILRSEMAAILTRIALPENRKRIVTEAELESLKKRYSANDLIAAFVSGCSSESLSIKSGFAEATGTLTEAGTSDPIVYLTDVVGQFNGADFKTITIRMKWDTKKVAEPKPQIFFATTAGGFAGARMLTATWDGKIAENGVAEFVFDTTKNAQFADTITGLRFDPFDAAATFAIESIVIG